MSSGTFIDETGPRHYIKDSEPTPAWLGSVSPEGKLTLKDERKFKHYLRTNLAGMEIRLVVDRKPQQRKLRSIEQNAYYWGVVVTLIGQHIGEHDKEAVHEALKRKLLSSRNKQGLEITPSSTELSVSEMSQYIDKVKDWASQYLGVYIPEPSEVA